MSSGDTAESPVRYEWELLNNVSLSPPTTGRLQPPLCTLCKSLFTDDSDSVISQTGDALKKSAEVCQLCYLRWSRLTAAQQDSCDASKETVTLNSYWPSLDFVYYPLDTKDASLISGWDREQIELLTVPREPSPLVDSLSPTNNSYPSWEISKNWLSDCLRDHPTCQQWALQTERHLPTRLVDLGSDPTIIRPRICITSKLDASTPYTTLSHCWGKLKILTLMTATLEAMEDRINVSRLTNTFREAMEVTKRLGIQYIWIDSLCIIQDSAEDWLQESKQMSNVYRHSFCSIAAAKSVDGTGGCFTTRNLFDVLPCTVDTSHCSNLREATYICGHKYLSDIDMNSSPLLSRAWVVQEVALAPRIIYYSERRMYWECLQRSICENSSPWSREAEKLAASIATTPRVTDRRRQEEQAKAKANAFQSVKVLIGSGSVYYRWKGVVEAYSTCALTYPDKDKLVAISGLARAIFPNNPTYLAGLWEENLTEHLRWTTKLKGCSRAQTYRAPSWSWASIDGPILYPKIKSNREGLAVRVHEAHTTLANGGDPYGPVIDGFIRIIGVLTKWRYTSELNGDGTRGMLDTLQCTVVADDGQPFAVESILYCLTLNLHTSLTDGLIIEPSGNTPGEYVRKGYFKVGGEDYFERGDEDSYDYEERDDEDDYDCKPSVRAFTWACLNPIAQARIVESDYEAKLDDVAGEPSQYVIKLI